MMTVQTVPTRLFRRLASGEGLFSRLYFSTSYLSCWDPGVVQSPAEAGQVPVEDRAVHPHKPGPFNVDVQIVDKEALLRPEAVLPEEGLINVLIHWKPYLFVEDLGVPEGDRALLLR